MQPAAPSGGLPPLPPGYTLQSGAAAPPAKAPEKPQAPGPAEEPRTFGDLFKAGARAWGEAIAGPVEAAAATVTGAIAKPVADIAGLVATGVDMATGNQDTDAAGFQREVQDKFTYHPRTGLGKATTEAIGAVGDATIGAAGRFSKSYYGGAAKMLGLPEPIAESIGNAAEEATKQAPNILGAKVASEIPKATASAAQGAAGAAARAESYVRNRVGVDWNSLPAAMRKTLTNIAKESGNLEKLDPKAIERQAALQGLRIPVETTRGKLTRNAADLRREAVASKTDAGEPIRQTDIRANRDIQANLEVLRGRKAGLQGGLHDPTEEGAPSSPSVRRATKPTEEVGGSVQGSLRIKAAASKRNYDALYKKARETEPDVRAPVKPLTALLEKNPEIQHLGWVQGWLGKAARAKQLAAKSPEPVPFEDATLAELHDLRSDANDIAATGGKEGHYAAKVRKAIDETMAEASPEGAKAWKAANDAFRKHQQEFKDQALIKKLTTNKAGDRALALEKTAQTIAKGSLDQIRQVKKSLLTQEGPRSARFEGRKAWRDLQGETVNRILEDARNVVATDEAERQVLTAAALRKSINSVGRDRLNEILGKSTADELYRILRAAKITRTEPAGRVTESGTVPNALVLAEKATKYLVPGAKYVIGARDALKSLGERGKAAQEAAQAVRSPLETAAAESEARAALRNAARRRQLTTLGAAAGITPREPPPP
jgi:hypothetical protein